MEMIRYGRPLLCGSHSGLIWYFHFSYLTSGFFSSSLPSALSLVFHWLVGLCLEYRWACGELDTLKWAPCERTRDLKQTLSLALLTPAAGASVEILRYSSFRSE